MSLDELAHFLHSKNALVTQTQQKFGVLTDEYRQAYYSSVIYPPPPPDNIHSTYQLMWVWWMYGEGTKFICLWEACFHQKTGL